MNRIDVDDRGRIHSMLTTVPIMNNMSTGNYKIYVGYLPDGTTADDLKLLFSPFGDVGQCSVIKNYGFVHMSNEKCGKAAIKQLNNSLLNGKHIRVEEAASQGKFNKLIPSAIQFEPKYSTVKFYVGNIPDAVVPYDINNLFSKYGNVIECDILKDYGFVHINTDNTGKVLTELNGYEITKGHFIIVQISISKSRRNPGMTHFRKCFECGIDGHFSKDCPNSKFNHKTGSVLASNPYTITNVSSSNPGTQFSGLAAIDYYHQYDQTYESNNSYIQDQDPDGQIYLSAAISKNMYDRVYAPTIEYDQNIYNQYIKELMVLKPVNDIPPPVPVDDYFQPPQSYYVHERNGEEEYVFYNNYPPPTRYIPVYPGFNNVHIDNGFYNDGSRRDVPRYELH